ncbi:LysR family transcriptional regulator [Sphingomonas sp. BK580]|uniref:LysR family transcriptional regulator n=1 Tax=Sphingomonas sp. BK580 TaxID=2586972 RepID=UPI00161CCF45|nr:LysR family transcriptional regulator [Sphingomonas sp. BK580]MBB3693564.1 DNA-binding transcriptional LysR family regulator [Sphingomonas sp. BK580]
MTRPTLNEVQAFCAVASHRSFRRAADELGLSPSTLSHTIGGLERQLGVRLFNRTTRSVATTSAGEALLRRMTAVLEEYDLALDEARQVSETIGGTLRISAAAAAIRPLFDEVVPLLKERLPEIQLECVADGRLIDIVEERFDAGIRFGDVVPRDMVGIPFGRPSRFVTLASPEYLRRHGSPGRPEDLTMHDCIRMRLASGRILPWSFDREGESVTLEPVGSLTLTDVTLQIDAAARGLGIAFVWEGAAAEAIARGHVTIVLERFCPSASRLLLYYPRNRQMPRALRALIDVLKDVQSRD